MTSLVDVAVEVGNLSRIEKDLSEAVAATHIEQTDEQKLEADNSANAEDFLPSKLRGKSLREVAEMYQNLESLNGRMANDLGQQRNLTDRLLDLKRNEDLGRNGGVQQPAKVEVNPAELLEKPTETLERFASAREAALVSQVTDRLNRVERAVLEREFNTKHPDVTAVAKSDEFTTWVRQSPTRQRAANAAASGDYGAADDLLTEFKAGKQAGQKQETRQVQQKDNLDAARSASLESGSNGSNADSTKKGKIYNRSDLMRLKLENPDKYYDEGYQAEIMRAYAEKRVK